MKKTRFTRGSALMQDSLVTPMHYHTEGADEFIVDVNGTKTKMDACQADGYVMENFDQPELTDVDHVSGGPTGISRRHILGGAAAGFGALLAGSALPRYSFASPGSNTDNQLLICVFMRGGFDGLSAVTPINDKSYYDARPTIAVKPDQTFELDGTWGMNKQMSALKEMWDDGDLAIVQGSGSPDVSRSHFQDQATVERAAPANMRSGWLGRHLQTSSEATGTIRGITIGSTSVLSLATNNNSTVAVSSLESFDLSVYGSDAARDRVRKLMEEMYKDAGGMAAQKSDDTFRAIDTLKSVRDNAAQSGSSGVQYPDSAWGRGLAEIAKLAKSGVGIEVACIDHTDWDMHKGLGSASVEGDWFSRRSRDFAEGLAALRKDLGALWDKTTVVTMSEFGRRVAENGSTGLDHGQGNTMFIAGGQVNGKKVFGEVPSLTDSNLEMGDVPITIDYRQALSEIVSKKLNNGHSVSEIFPGFTPGQELGVV